MSLPAAGEGLDTRDQIPWGCQSSAQVHALQERTRTAGLGEQASSQEAALVAQEATLQVGGQGCRHLVEAPLSVVPAWLGCRKSRAGKRWGQQPLRSHLQSISGAGGWRFWGEEGRRK